MLDTAFRDVSRDVSTSNCCQQPSLPAEHYANTMDMYVTSSTTSGLSDSLTQSAKYQVLKSIDRATPRVTSSGRRRVLKQRMKQRRASRCVVCGEKASGMYFGAMVCLPCKSFFIRCTKEGQAPQLTCLAQRNCQIDRANRMRCQYCRFQKCLQAGMMRREKPEVVEAGEGQELCRVCGDIANGVHFGVMTCEGCKKFFRRALKEADIYECKASQRCPLNPRSRNACRLCRYNKCRAVGMSRQAIRMGRPKKLKPEAAYSFCDASYFYDKSMLYADTKSLYTQFSPANCTSPGCYCGTYQHAPACHVLTPVSPGACTDSGVESDSSTPPLSSRESMQRPYSGIHCPYNSHGTMTSHQQMTSHRDSVVPQAMLWSPAANQRYVPEQYAYSGAVQGKFTEIHVKSEPADVTDDDVASQLAASTHAASSRPRQASINSCSDSDELNAEEMSLEELLNHVTADEPRWVDDVNDVMAALGQHLGSLGSNEKQEQPHVSGVTTSMGQHVSGVTTSMEQHVSGVTTPMGQHVSGVTTSMGQHVSGVTTSMGQHVSNVAASTGQHVSDVPASVSQSIIGVPVSAGPLESCVATSSEYPVFTADASTNRSTGATGVNPVTYASCAQGPANFYAAAPYSNYNVPMHNCDTLHTMHTFTAPHGMTSHW